MNGLDEFVKLLKDRDNQPDYAPLFGEIISLPSLQIKLSDKVLLKEKVIRSIIDVNTTDQDGRYINLNKTAVLLPYCNRNKFLLIGVCKT